MWCWKETVVQKKIMADKYQVTNLKQSFILFLRNFFPLHLISSKSNSFFSPFCFLTSMANATEKIYKYICLVRLYLCFDCRTKYTPYTRSPKSIVVRLRLCVGHGERKFSCNHVKRFHTLCIFIFMWFFFSCRLSIRFATLLYVNSIVIQIAEI